MACAEALTRNGAGPAAQQEGRRNRPPGAGSDRLGDGDPQFPAVGGTRLADDDVDVAAERRQKPQQAL